jgi:uncharacterized protein (DUF2141 family)
MTWFDDLRPRVRLDDPPGFAPAIPVGPPKMTLLGNRRGGVRVWLLTALGAAALLAASSSPADPSTSGVLTIRVTGLRSNDGQVGCLIYGSAKGFPTDPSAALQRRWCAIESASATCAFDPIPAGTYAVACIHDENKNGKLDMGLFGPKEGTVASNHAKGFMGPPSFDKAKFSFVGAATEMQLRMGY